MERVLASATVCFAAVAVICRHIMHRQSETDAAGAGHDLVCHSGVLTGGQRTEPGRSVWCRAGFEASEITLVAETILQTDEAVAISCMCEDMLEFERQVRG